MSDSGPVTRPTPRPSDLPSEVQGWNWGAFLLNWVWGLGNNTWIALLMFVPGVNLVMPFVLGAKGNQWAWENNTWRDVEHFKRTQRIWGWAGFGALIAIPAFFAIVVSLVMTVIHSSDPYRMTVAEVRDHPRLERRFGTPVEPSGWLTLGNVQIHGNTGWADLRFDVTGPLGTGEVYAELELADGVWRFIALNVTGENGHTVVLVGDRGT